MERVLHVLILLDIHFIILNYNHRSLVVIGSTIVRGTKYCYNRGERLGTSPTVHFETLSLNLVSTNDR